MPLYSINVHNQYMNLSLICQKGVSYRIYLSTASMQGEAGTKEGWHVLHSQLPTTRTLTALTHSILSAISKTPLQFLKQKYQVQFTKNERFNLHCLERRNHKSIGIRLTCNPNVKLLLVD